MSLEERPTTAIVLSLIGGSLMFLSGAMMFMMFMYGWVGFGMMGGYMGMMGSIGGLSGFMSGLSLVGLVSGILVIIGALILNARPAEHTAWGTIILVFSILSLLGMGGFIVGAVLGITGGAFALSWRTTAKV